MAALAATALAEAAVRAKRYWDQFEQRLSNYGALKAFMDNANALLPQDQLEAIKNDANARDVVFPTINKATLTVITARSCTIAGVDPVSVKPALTSITRGFEIRVYPKVSENNYISEIDQFSAGLRNGIRSAAVNLDNFGAATLESNKSTSLQTVGLPGLNVVANAYQVDWAQRDRIYYYIPTILERNDMNNGSMNNIMTTEGRELMLEYEAKGLGQDTNMRGVLEGTLPSANGYRHYTSNRISNGAGISETHYLIPFGGIGVFTWNDSDARARRTGPNGKSKYLYDDPILGIRWDVQEEPVCDDLTGVYGAGKGYEAVFGTKYQFAADFGWLVAYSSDTTKANLKLEILAGA